MFETGCQIGRSYGILNQIHLNTRLGPNLIDIIVDECLILIGDNVKV
jgi:hypothetical protein